MCRIILTAFILIFHIHLFCQVKDKNIDTLRLVISGKNSSDTERINALLQLGEYYTNLQGSNVSALDSAYYFLNDAQKIAGNLGLLKLQNNAFVRMGNLYFRQGKILLGKDFYMKVIGYYKKSGDYEHQAATWNSLGLAIPLNDSISKAEKIKSFVQSRLLYKDNNNMVEEANELTNIATAHTQSGALDMAEAELLEAIDIYKLAKHKNLMEVYDDLVENSKLKGDLNKQLYYGLEGIKNVEANGDSINYYLYYKIAATFSDMGQYDKSLEWVAKALSNLRAETVNDNTYDNIYLCTSFMVYDLLKLGRFSQALAVLKDVTKFKPAFTFVQKIMINESMGDCYAALKKFEKAELYYLKMVNLLEQNMALKDQGNLNPIYVGGLIHHYKTIANFYVNFSKYDKAEFYINKLFLLPKALVKPVTLAGLHFMQFKVDSAKNKLKSAIEHYEIFKQLNDSVFNETKSKQIAELQVKYEMEKNEKDLQLLKIKEQFQLEELKRSVQARNLTYALAAGLFLLIMLGFSRYRSKIKNNQQLRLQQKEINDQNGELTVHILQQQKLMSEKEWLMKEIHHRVKNNLQIVMSLLNSQSVYLKDTAALEAIKESQHRIHAISLIHKKLYQSENFSVVNMKTYIIEVVDYLAENLDPIHHINFTLSIDLIRLNVGQAVPLGLIINEAVTNAVKYAFSEKNKGNIKINMHHAGYEKIELTICDDGIGLSSNMDWRNTQSLGMNLMQGLSKQLDGCFNIINNNGLLVSLIFKPGKEIDSNFV